MYQKSANPSLSRIFSISGDTFSKDILEFIKEDKIQSQNQNNYRKNEIKSEPQKEENVTTYVSGSADFDPSKKKDFGRNNYKQNNNNKKNNNNNNKNRNK